jgi:O-acetylhomoserine (thiol)-lyase
MEWKISRIYRAKWRISWIVYEALGAAAFIAKVRIEGLRDYGAALSHLMLSNYSRTWNIAVRVKNTAKNGLALAQWLESQTVAW